MSASIDRVGGRPWLALGAAFVLLAAGGCQPQSESESGRSPAAQTEVLPPASPASADPLLPLPADAQEAKVERHTDGDTLAVRAYVIGGVLSSTSQITVRLLEIDTPETKRPGTPIQCYGPEASAQLAKLAPVGAKVYVAADKDRTDTYGRDLLYLWDSAGRSVNLAMVDGGFATAVLYQPNDRYIAVLRVAEAKAKAAKRGLWGACAAGAIPAPAPTTPGPPPTRGATPSRGHCDASYPTVCIPPAPPDLDCGEVSHRRFVVLSPDPHGFDADNDGIGCESG